MECVCFQFSDLSSCSFSLQQALLSVTNAFEGTLFVNQAAPANARQYALDLFPKLDTTAADRVEALYGGLGTQLFQTNAIEGESQ